MSGASLPDASSAPAAHRYRIEWLPGSDELLGRCHCGAQRTGEDPIQLWQWLLGHPDGHQPPAVAEQPAA